MSSPSGQINYAHASGIESVAGAAVFAAFYIILLPYYIWRAIRNPTYVLIVLSVFCAIRVTAFVMRAVLAGSESAGEDLNLVIAESIVYSVGFFGLLYSTYTLVLDRQIVSGVAVTNPISMITSNRRLIRLALLAAVVVGIVGSTYISSSNPSEVSLSKTLRRVSVIIFLVVTALLVLHTLFLVREERFAFRSGPSQAPGATHGMHILCLIVIFLLIREIYFTATIGNISHVNEAVWYPLGALPELLAVFLYVVPGLVPEKRELNARSGALDKDYETNELA